MLRFHSSMDIRVRLAVPDDAEAILGVHREAVLKTAGIFYKAEVLDTWAAKLTEEGFERVRQEIRDEGMIVLVAESNSRVLGFGMVVPGDSELRAVYTHPEYGRQGIGTAVLRKLEELASGCGVERLNLESSINAEAFYGRHGYQVVERTVHRFRSGQEMQCVRMSKVLK